MLVESKEEVGLWLKIFKNQEKKQELGSNEIFHGSKWEARIDLDPTA